MQVFYRIQQGLLVLFAFTRRVDDAFVQQHLSPSEFALFKQLAKSEQLHSIHVLQTVLQQAEQTPHDLAVAALLHDVGKSRYRLMIWQKTLSVLVKKFLPHYYGAWSKDERLTFWRAPFVVRQYHAQWSGKLLSQAGSSERAIWLAEHHQDSAQDWLNHPHYPLLIRLQAADDAN